jgi:hypothetical protein
MGFMWLADGLISLNVTVPISLNVTVPFGNLTITVTPAGEISLRLPKPLEHLANAPRGRYQLSCPAVFPYRDHEWAQRIGGANSVSYTITRKAGHGGRYLTAAWAIPTLPYWAGRENCEAGGDAYAAGELLAADLNDGHLAVRGTVTLFGMCCGVVGFGVVVVDQVWVVGVLGGGVECGNFIPDGTVTLRCSRPIFARSRP